MKVHVAAAADLALAFKELGAAYEKESGNEVVFSFGSTGLLAKQITEGAPFEVFAAANASFIDDVVKTGACFGDTKKTYATGHLVFWTKSENAPKTPAELRDARFTKIAIASPEHAPYGKAAKEALVKSGAWESVEKKMVYGENVQQAFQFADSGNADVAIIALSLAISAKGHYEPVDPALHAPLEQVLAVCNGGKKDAPRLSAAVAFVEFVGSPEGRATMKKYGFLLPEESVGPR